MAKKTTTTKKGSKTKKLVRALIVLGASVGTDILHNQIDKQTFMAATADSKGVMPKVNYKKLATKGLTTIAGLGSAVMVDNDYVEAVALGVMASSANGLKNEAANGLSGLGANNPSNSTFISMYDNAVRGNEENAKAPVIS